MLTIDKMSRVPIYEQIIKGVEKEILSGLLNSGDQLPSIRELSVTLSANPNTVQKAFIELDRMGLILPHPGRGYFVSQNAKEILQQRLKNRLTELEVLVHQLHKGGISKDEIIQAVNNGLQEKFTGGIL